MTVERIDLASASIEQLTLRSGEGDRALIFFPATSYHDKHDQPDAYSYLDVETGGGEFPECCWGVTNTGYR